MNFHTNLNLEANKILLSQYVERQQVGKAHLHLLTLNGTNVLYSVSRFAKAFFYAGKETIKGNTSLAKRKFTLHFNKSIEHTHNYLKGTFLLIGGIFTKGNAYRNNSSYVSL